MSNLPQAKPSTAFLVQAVVSFAISLGALIIALINLHADAWVRAFLAVGLLYLVTSTFTLAKCVRDLQEASTVHGRIDQARVEKLLSEHDPYRAVA